MNRCCEWAAAMLVLLTQLGVATAAEILPVSDGASACQASPARVGACYQVRGRLAVYNGTPSLRIRPQGQRRFLGVLPDENPEALPEAIRGLIRLDQDVDGVFTVCPLASERSGHLQNVCIESARKVVAQPHSKDNI